MFSKFILWDFVELHCLGAFRVVVTVVPAFRNPGDWVVVWRDYEKSETEQRLVNIT